MALVDSLAEGIEDQASPISVPISLDPSSNDDLLALLLDEIVYVGEVLGAIPVSVELSATEDHGITGFLETVPMMRVRMTGRFPTQVAGHEILVSHQDDRWRAEATLLNAAT